MAQQTQRTRPYVLAADEFEDVDDPNVLSADDLEDVPPTAPRTWSDRLGLNEPTDSRLTGFLRGSGAGAVDMVQGAASAITGQLNNKLRSDNEAATALGPTNIPQKRTLPDVERPANMSGAIGSALPVIGEMALPGGAPKAVRAGIDALPNAARAGAKFEQVMSAAGDIPVDVEATGKSALRIMDLAERGGTMPKAVRDLLKRVTDPSKPPMAYRESRDFATNLGKLSVDEMNRLKPTVKRQVAQMAADLNLANANAAKAAGKGAEYKSAMREYANAMRMRDTVDTAIKHSKKAALGAAGLGGAAYWFSRD